MQPPVAQIRPAPADGGEHLPEVGGIDHPQHRLPLILQTDGHRKYRQSLAEIVSSVQGIHHPTVCRLPGMFSRLFAQNGVLRIVFTDAGNQTGFALLVSTRHHVIHARLGLYVQTVSPEIREMNLPRFLRPFLGKRQCPVQIQFHSHASNGHPYILSGISMPSIPMAFFSASAHTRASNRRKFFKAPSSSFRIEKSW